MNTKNNRRFGIYLPLMILLSTVACTLRTVAAFLGVDAYGYFDAQILSSVSAWILTSAILIMLTYPIAYARRTGILVRHTTPLTFIPSLLSGLVLIFFVGEIGKKLYSTILLIDRLLLLILFALGIFSILFFFSLAVVESGVSDKKANYGMVLVLLLGVYAASLYLNTDIPRNAHTELAEEMTLIALSLFFLYEIRISLDKPKQNLYVCFGFIAVMLSAYTALPSLIFYIASGTLLLSSLSIFLLILALMVFITARLYLFNISPNDEPCAMVRSLVEVAKERAQTVLETEALYTPTPTAPSEDEENSIPSSDSEDSQIEERGENEQTAAEQAYEALESNTPNVVADVEAPPITDPVQETAALPDTVEDTTEDARESGLDSDEHTAEESTLQASASDAESTSSSEEEITPNEFALEFEPAESILQASPDFTDKPISPDTQPQIELKDSEDSEASEPALVQEQTAEENPVLETQPKICAEDSEHSVLNDEKGEENEENSGH